MIMFQLTRRTLKSLASVQLLMVEMGYWSDLKLDFGRISIHQIACQHTGPWHAYISCRFLSAGSSYFILGCCNWITPSLFLVSSGRVRQKPKNWSTVNWSVEGKECAACCNIKHIKSKNTCMHWQKYCLHSILHLCAQTKALSFSKCTRPHTSILPCWGKWSGGVLNYWWRWALFLEGKGWVGGGGISAFRNRSCLSPGAKASDHQRLSPTCWPQSALMHYWKSKAVI